MWKSWYALLQLVFLSACTLTTPTIGKTGTAISTAEALNSPTSISVSPTPFLPVLPSPTAFPAITPSPTQTATPAAVLLASRISIANASTLKQLIEVQFSPWALVLAVAWSPDGRLLAVSAGESIFVYDSSNLALKVALVSLNIGALTSALSFSPDGRWLAAGSHDGKVRLWETANLPGSGSPALTIKAHNKGVNCLAFSPDGQRLASGGDDAVARLWNIQSGRNVGQIIGGTFAIPDMAFTPDGTALAIINGPLVRVRDVQSGRMLVTLHVEAPLYSLAFSPDGRFLALGDNGNAIWLWDAAQALHSAAGKAPLPLKLTGHAGKKGSPAALIWSLAFSPDGSLLASAGGDATVRLWEASNGRLINTLVGFGGAVTSLAFSPDGRTLAVGSLDGTLRLWGAGP